MVVSPLRCPVLVGRAQELEELVARRLAAARGKGSCVLLSGDAGMGKSRLIAAFRESLRNGRAAVGIGLAREFGNAPYGPLREALSGIGAVSQLAHELNRGEQLEAIAGSVSAACRKRNCVVIVEDAQWADEGTLRALLYLLPAVGSLRLLLIVTYRSDAVSENDAIARFMPRFERFEQTHRIALEPLTDRDVRRLVRLTLGERARLPAHAVTEIVERADGNPFFAEELLKGALERSASRAQSGALPSTIRAAVLERCASLDEEAREVLVRAAVLGRRFDTALLASICGKPKPELLAILRRLRELQIIEELPGTPAGYAFLHELLREAVYSTMLRDELEPLHQGILEALEDSGATTFDLGFHAFAAGDAAKSLRYNELAGDEAMRMHAYADARLCYERATTGAQSAAVRGRLLNKAADAAAGDSKADVAASLYQMAAATFEETGDEDRVADLYRSMSSQARITGDTFASRTGLERAIARLPREAAVARAKLRLALAFTYIDRCETDTATGLIEQSGAVESSATYASALAYCAAVRADMAAVRAASMLYLKRCEAESPEAALQARFNLYFTLTVLGIDDEALAGFDSLLPELAERRLRSFEILACANSALIHARATRWDAARAAIERGLSIPEATTTGPLALAAAGLTIANALHDDELAQRSAPAEAIETALASRINSTIGRVAGPYARFLEAAGHRDQAGAVLQAALEVLAGPFGATETLIAAIELGEATTRRLARSFLPQLEAMDHLPLYRATALDMRTFDACREDDRDAAAVHALAAASLYRDLRWPMHELRMREALAQTPAASIRAHADLRTASLSPREREIAELVARGLPNRRLAEHLAVSQRTIEKHITSIFTKLGLRNRTELTVLMMRRPH